MNTMLAARLIKPGLPLSIDEVPVPEPAPDEVLVKVGACGLCGTDLHLGLRAGAASIRRAGLHAGKPCAALLPRLQGAGAG